MSAPGPEAEALPPLSPGQRLRSALLDLRFRLSRRLRWRRPGYVETPALALDGLPPATQARIAELAAAYGERFEQRFDRRNALENYLYLDLLDRLRGELGSGWPQGGEWLDVGSKNFWYASVLRAALRPSRLIGIEIEGYRIYRDGHSRHDYAMHYLRDLTDTEYRVQDAFTWRQPVDGISCFYPFLLPGTVLAWGLPARLLRPRALFAHLASLLRPGGHLLMVNQGLDEWQLVQALLQPTGLRLLAQRLVAPALLPRPAPPVLSLFVRD